MSHRMLGAVAAILFGAFLVSAALYDTSWDGASYHVPAILALQGNWNPLAGPGDVEKANWFANGLWIVEAALADFFGGVEAGKIVNAGALVAALLTLVPALATVLGRPLLPVEILVACLVVANPVALAQLVTFHVDGFLYAMGLVLVGAVLLAGSRHRRFALATVPAGIVLLTGAKLSAAYFAPGLVAIALVAARWAVPAPRAVALVAAASFVAGTVAIGYRPYVTNPRDHGTLAYTGGFGLQRPAELAGVLPPLMLAFSAFGRTSTVAEPARLKLPLMVAPRELVAMGTPDPRIGGFGPFFALELLASGVFLALGIHAGALRAEPGRRAVLIVAGGLAGLCAIFPEPWLARYVPFFGAVPLLALLAGGPASSGRSLRAVLLAIVLLAAAANAALAFGGNLARTALGNWRFHALTRVLAERALPVVVVPAENQHFEITAAYRLGRQGIRSRIGSAADCGEQVSTERDMIICIARD